MAQFEAYVRRAEAMVGRVKSRQPPQETADEKDLRLAEQQRRLEEEKNRLEKELEELEKTSIIRKADLQRQIEWHERQIEAVKRQRQENRGFATTLEY
jgi:hypothetical protein